MRMPKESWAELALHPVRIRILRSVAGARVTTRELVGLLPDVPQATLYRQLTVLVNSGLLEVVEEHKIRGAVERVYALAASATPDAAALAAATSEDHDRYFTAFMSSLLAEFSRYLQRERIDFAADGVGYHQIVMHLSDAELAEFAADFSALVGPLLTNTPGDGRQPRLLATILLPAGPQVGTSAEASSGEEEERGNH
ncbi:DNA-binding transcriptional ArsR family regulator [Hamadaea flava]|uniref:Helix-turn-helix domain-containing protein n=1 Tax=Hamadaea flava TaxID=1742688 RepID=A0ABV8LL63_9ACTN|nr:helix-turn-helix domain-containing protein [Hamadaea flava]MCP2324164.1 DNA-binding transcriptional ArsR family regulator [Hamadaea flava]